MKLSLATLLFSIGLSYCAAKHKNSSKNEAANTDCNEILKVFVHTSIDNFLTQDRFTYLSKLNENDLKNFFPYAEYEVLKNLALDLQTIQYAELSRSLKQEALQLIRQEAAIDKNIFDRLKVAIEAWDIAKANELKLRNTPDLMGLNNGVTWTQADLTSYLDAKIKSFNTVQALERFLPTSALKQYYFSHSPSASAFKWSFYSTDTIAIQRVKKWIVKAGLASEDTNSIRVKMRTYLQGLIGEDEIDQSLVLRLYAAYLELNPKVNSLQANQLSYQMIDSLTLMEEEWASGPFRASSGISSKEAGILPTSLYLQYHLHNTRDVFDFYQSLLIRDFFANPLDVYASALFDRTKITEIFQLTSKGDELWKNGYLKNDERLSASIRDLRRYLSGEVSARELGTQSLFTHQSKIKPSTKILLLTILGTGSVLGGTFGLLEITNAF